MVRILCFGLMMMTFVLDGYAYAVTIVYHDFAPYEYEENNQPAGIVVRIVKKIFKRVEIPLTLKHLPFKRARKDVKSGKYDGLFILYKTPEREKIYDYTEPVVYSPLVFFTRKDSEIVFNGKLSDLKGLKIGVFHGYTYGSEFDNFPDFTLDSATSHRSNMIKLKGKRTDAYICDRAVGIYSSHIAGTVNDLKILPKPLKTMELYMVFTKGKHLATIEKINPIIKEMNDSGEMNRLIEEFLSKYM